MNSRNLFYFCALEHLEDSVNKSDDNIGGVYGSPTYHFDLSFTIQNFSDKTDTVYYAVNRRKKLIAFTSTSYCIFEYRTSERVKTQTRVYWRRLFVKVAKLTVNFKNYQRKIYCNASSYRYMYGGMVVTLGMCMRF